MGKVIGSVLITPLLLLLLLAPTSGADAEKELEGIKKRMEKERRGIAKVKRRESSVLQELERIERELDRKDKRLKRISSAMESVLADLGEKEEQMRALGSSLKARRELLKTRVRALYKWQRSGTPFMLLSGVSSVAELMQRRRYLELTLAYDQKLLLPIREEAARQDALAGELAKRREELDKQRHSLVELKESIRMEREKKREVLSSLQREKQAHVEALRELEQAAHRLQTMMEEISRKSAAPGMAVDLKAHFEMMKGKLDYPVRGEVMIGFGKTRHPEFSAVIFRNGIDIKAPMGEEVRAVDGGTVVFADRFSGYGKMMIIDHGWRYYTVYAHLSDLLKHTGEPVSRGEPIALVGDSDSLVGARLYFEIRKDGKPLDPLPWFRK